MAELKPSNEEKYLKWLSSKVSPSKVSDYYLGYREIEKYCLDKKIIHEPLLEITDIKTIGRVRDTVERNRVFRFFHRANKKKLVEAIGAFYKYVKEESSVNLTATVKYRDKHNLQQSKFDDAESCVLRYMKNIDKSQTLDEIAEACNKIGKSEIVEELKKDESIVLLDERLKKYIYAPSFPISFQDVEKIRSFLRQELKKHDFAIDVDLREYINNNMINLSKTIANYTRYGWRDCVGYLLQDEFSFKNAIISYRGNDLSILDCYRNVCKNREVISVYELKKLSKALHLNVPFGTVLSECVRINQETFIRKDLLDFDVSKVDEILNEICKEDYISLYEFKGFEIFCEIAVPWNKYVLESYLQEYSKMFKLINLNFSVNSYLGAMVRRDSNIKSYDDLVFDVLKKTDQWINVDTAMEYLVKNKYQANTSYVNIEDIIDRIEKERKLDYSSMNKVKDDIKFDVDEEKTQSMANVNSKSYASSKQHQNDKCVVDFNNLADYSYTKPIEYFYFEDSNKSFNSWKEMYVSLVNVLIEDYDYIIKDLKNRSINNPNGRIDFVDSFNKSELVSPKVLSNGMYIETNLSSINIVKKIKSLLELCLVDYENVKIYYEKKKDTSNTDIKNERMNIESRNDNGEAFYKWMRENKGLAEATCKNYYYGINNIDSFAKEKEIYYGSIYDTSDYKCVYQREQELLQNYDFMYLNDSQHNRLTASLNNYIEFLNANFGINNYNYEVDTETLKRYQKILSENFPRNFRYNSRLDMKKFRGYWERTWGSELNKSDDEITDNIKIVTIFYSEGDKNFALVPETILSEENKYDLLGYIDKAFESGKPAIYYNALYEETSSILYESKINNADMLREYLKYITDNKYYFRKSYFTVDKDIEIDQIDEIKNYLIAKREPVATEKICSDLSHIPSNKIKLLLKPSNGFISNSNKERFHPDIVDITDEELSGIAEIINIEIENNGFILENELMHAAQTKFPEVLERHPELTDLGMRDAIGYKLKDKYSFNGKIISGKNQNFSMSDIYEMFCKKNSKITLKELKSLKKDLNSSIYFDVIYENTLRISEDEFVSKELANFNITETDMAIDNFCNGDYISIQDVKYFASFPDAGFAWNSYLLEHYVANYSKKYNLLHTNFNESSCVGAIVKVNAANIENFYDLIVNALADSNIVLDNDTALNYLCNRGFLGRRSYKDIEKALIQASTIREKKG